jgi:hypothetical protein
MIQNRLWEAGTRQASLPAMSILCEVFLVFTVFQGEIAPTLKEAMNVFLKESTPFHYLKSPHLIRYCINYGVQAMPFQTSEL